MSYYGVRATDKQMNENGGILPLLPKAVQGRARNKVDHQQFPECVPAWYFLS